MQNLFMRSPWERQSVVALGQPVEAVSQPPNQPLINSFPVVPVALAVLGVAVAGKLLLGDPRRGSRIGQQYSWNAAQTTDQSGFTGLTPQQRLLQQAEESMNAPRAETPQQRLLKQAQQSMNPGAGDCYTCASGSDVRSGVDASTAAALKQQGYRCRKDECAQRSAYGGGTYSGFNPFGNSMTTAAPAQVSDYAGGDGYGNYAGGGDYGNYGGGMMEGPRRYRVVNA